MTPQECIRELDAGLKEAGSTVKLVRPGGGLADLTCRGVLRNFKAEELIGSIQQGDRLLILSPTDLGPDGWLDVEEGDRVTAAQQWYRVQAPDVIRVGDIPVRVEFHLRGM